MRIFPHTKDLSARCSPYLELRLGLRRTATVSPRALVCPAQTKLRLAYVRMPFDTVRTAEGEAEAARERVVRVL